MFPGWYGVGSSFKEFIDEDPENIETLRYMYKNTGVEMFRKLLDQGEAGDNVGLLLRGIDKNEIKRGMVLCKPGQIKAHSRLKLRFIS